MANATQASQESEDHFNLLTKWWFYVILFVVLYTLTVAVHVFFDYKSWQAERDREVQEEVKKAR